MKKYFVLANYGFYYSTPMNLEDAFIVEMDEVTIRGVEKLVESQLRETFKTRIADKSIETVRVKIKAMNAL